MASKPINVPDPLPWDWEDVKGIHKRVCRLEVEFSKANITEEAFDKLNAATEQVRRMQERMAVFERIFQAIGHAAKDYYP